MIAGIKGVIMLHEKSLECILNTKARRQPKSYLLFLLLNLVFFLSLLCLCLLIFFLRHFLTFPTHQPSFCNISRCYGEPEKHCYPVSQLLRCTVPELSNALA